MVGYSRAVATPIAALSACNRALGRKDVRPLARERGRQAERQFAGQREFAQVELGRRPCRRRAPGENDERVARGGELLAQPRERGTVGCELRFGAQHVGARRFSGLEFEAHQLQVAHVVGHDLFGCLELRAQRRDRDRRRHDIAGERKVGRREFVALLLGERLLLLDAARGGAERVGRIARGRADQ